MATWGTHSSAPRITFKEQVKEQVELLVLATSKAPASHNPEEVGNRARGQERSWGRGLSVTQTRTVWQCGQLVAQGKEIQRPDGEQFPPEG